MPEASECTMPRCSARLLLTSLHSRIQDETSEPPHGRLDVMGMEGRKLPGPDPSQETCHIERRSLDPTFTGHLTAERGSSRISQLLSELDRFIP